MWDLGSLTSAKAPNSGLLAQAESLLWVQVPCSVGDLVFESRRDCG